MKTVQFLPWQHAVAHSWLENRDRFAHAWLVHGAAGIGKLQFALAAAASLLCESPQQGIACGHCMACGWVAAGNHPDLRRLRPQVIALAEEAQGDCAATDATFDEESMAVSAALDSAANKGAASKREASKRHPSQEIRIAQIRSLESWFYTATHRGGWRVALLYPAQALNSISANALLKVLEEPPAHTVFILVADALDHLLPTLLSRCRRLPLAVPSGAQALQWLVSQGVAEPTGWLAAAGGAPLGALRLAQSRDHACPVWLTDFVTTLAHAQAIDVSGLVDQLEKIPPAQWVDTLQRLYVDLTLVKVALAPRYFSRLAQEMGQIVPRLNAVKIAQTARWLTAQRAIAGHPLSSKLFVQAALQRIIVSCQI